MRNNNKSIVLAILAAALYAISSPVSKLLLKEIPPTMMAALLYLGAGTGMLIFGIIQKKFGNKTNELHLSKDEMPFVIGMIVLDTAAPIFLMIGLTLTSSENTSLLNNFEIVATSIIALFIFKETISKRLWLGIGLITLSSIILSVEDISSFSFSFGSIFVLLACICWGFENNCTRMLSKKDPLEVVILKGFGSGIGSLIIAFILNETINNFTYLALALILGFVSYGLSIFFYVYAQRELGAAKTSAYYAISPFIGVAFSFLIFKDIPTVSFIVALMIMIIATYLVSTDNK
ncbi:DMT family transporter [Sedimentibacter sp. zth1]|uniref:DMT family transporter n=1 Tax=Sedimentibacter sp. zth1 TaxID=2816908 RepID=UPI001A933CD3|nr:DMT family transporter [Sedimentibacter sp. zth1]QSX06483.1 DMT family transporter [Sedimentibacter sp. zth1]